MPFKAITKLQELSNKLRSPKTSKTVKKLRIDRLLLFVAGIFYTLDAFALMFISTFTTAGIAVYAEYEGNPISSAVTEAGSLKTVIGEQDNLVKVLTLPAEESSLSNSVPVYVVNSSVAGKKALNSQLIDDTAKKLGIDPEQVDISKSTVELSDVSTAIVPNGNLAIKTVSVQLKGNNGTSLTNVDSERSNIVVREFNDEKSGPEILFKSDRITINNGDPFNAMSNITYIEKENNILPVLMIDDSEVNTEEDGVYTVNIHAIDNNGVSNDLSYEVEVKTPQEVLDAREAERLVREEAERQAEEAARAAAARQNQYSSAAAMSSPYAVRGSGYNPYAGGWSNCTWGAWQALYNARGIALPSMGNATNWYHAAQSMGYSTGSTPAPGSIVCWAYGTSALGHVAYVSQVSADGSSIYIIEGGYLGGYMERWTPAWDGNMWGYIYP